MTTPFNQLLQPTDANNHIQRGDTVLVGRNGSDVFRLSLMPQGFYLPAAAAIAAPDKRPPLVYRAKNKWAAEDVSAAAVYFTAALVNHCALLLEAADAADDLVPAAWAGETTVNLYAFDGSSQFTAETTAQTAGTPIWLAKGAVDASNDDIRFMAGASAPAVTAGNGAVRIGYISDATDSANNNYGVCFNLTAASGFVVG